MAYQNGAVVPSRTVTKNHYEVNLDCILKFDSHATNTDLSFMGFRRAAERWE